MELQEYRRCEGDIIVGEVARVKEDESIGHGVVMGRVLKILQGVWGVCQGCQDQGDPLRDVGDRLSELLGHCQLAGTKVADRDGQGEFLDIPDVISINWREAVARLISLKVLRYQDIIAGTSLNRSKIFHKLIRVIKSFLK